MIDALRNLIDTSLFAKQNVLFVDVEFSNEGTSSKGTFIRILNFQSDVKWKYEMFFIFSKDDPLFFL